MALFYTLNLMEERQKFILRNIVRFHYRCDMEGLAVSLTVEKYTKSSADVSHRHHCPDLL